MCLTCTKLKKGVENKLNLNHQIKVRMIPQHQKDHTIPGARHVFSYDVTIYNTSLEDVQLTKRHWFITDGVLGVREVEGEGVIGEKPILSSGESYSYQSWCPISEDFGSISGYFTFRLLRTEEIGYANIDTVLLIPDENLN